MNHTLSLYDFHNNDIRVIEINGEPWFAAKDVCDVLDHTNSRKALLDHCADSHKTLVLKSKVTGSYVSFPNRGMIFVNEAGLYSLIFASQMPEARAFKDWVTSVILPAIRKHGGYIAGEEKVATGEMSEDEFMARAFVMATTKLEDLKKDYVAARKVLETCSLQTYCGLNGVFLTPRQRSRLSSLASRTAKKEGIVLQKEDRVFFFSGVKIPTKVNLYPRDLLDRAAAQLGMFEVREKQPLSFP